MNLFLSQVDRNRRQVTELPPKRPLPAVVGHVSDLGDLWQQLPGEGREQRRGRPLDGLGENHQRVGRKFR